MKTHGTISISRVYSNSDNNKKIEFSVRCEKSRTEFLSFLMSAEDFALCITGLSGIEVDLDVKNLDIIGKTRESESLVITLTEDQRAITGTFDKKKIERFITENQHLWVNPGWKLRESLSSKNSIVYGVDGNMVLNVSQYRYV